MLEIGQNMLSFSLSDQHNTLFDIDKVTSKYIVIYFFPRAMTPGCTRQACSVSLQKNALARLGATVVGISTDPVARLTKFAEKEQLNHTLLADVDHQVSSIYGAWQKKNRYGREYWGIERMTYIIDETRRIAAVWPKVNANTHTDDIINWLEKR